MKSFNLSMTSVTFPVHKSLYVEASSLYPLFAILFQIKSSTRIKNLTKTVKCGTFSIIYGCSFPQLVNLHLCLPLLQIEDEQLTS